MIFQSVNNFGGPRAVLVLNTVAVRNLSCVT